MTLTYGELIRGAQRDVRMALTRAEVFPSGRVSVDDAFLERVSLALLAASVAIRENPSVGLEVSIPPAALDWPAAFGSLFESAVWVVDVPKGGPPGRRVAAEGRVSGASLSGLVVTLGDGPEMTVSWRDVGEDVFFVEADAQREVRRRNDMRETGA